MDNTKTDILQTIKDQAAEIALKQEEGGIFNLWPVPDNEEEREYWKKVFKIGYGVGYKQAIEDALKLVNSPYFNRSSLVEDLEKLNI